MALSDTYKLIPPIPCNGIKPSKAEVYKLAAELQEIHKAKSFLSVVIAALKSYDYDYDNNDEDDYYDYDYHYHFLTSDEKVIALLFLSEIYS